MYIPIKGNKKGAITAMKYDLELITDEQNALSIILKQIYKDSIVLEFGPANGRMTKYLKEVLGCTVYIVEIDKVAAQDAMKYAVDGLVGDIESYEWLEKWSGVEFDYIIFADVLEHLYNPQEVLSKTKRLLKENGKTIISVPNIGHNSVLINLYNNIFNYTPLGILDNTHIHFFAYNTLKEFCHYAGYFPIVEDATYADVGKNEISSSYKDVNKDIAFQLKERDYGKVYQYVFTLQKEEYVMTNSYVTDYRIRKNAPWGEFKIYLDRGSGFCEDNCITFYMLLDKRLIKEIVLENCEEVRAIRIDPLNVSGIYKFNKMQVVSQNETKNWKIEECAHNGSVYGEYLFVENDDPQIVIEVSGLKGKATLNFDIEYERLYPDENALKACLNIIKRNTRNIIDVEAISIQMKQQQNDLTVLDKELEKRAIELERRMDEINLRDKEIDKQRNELKLSGEELERRAVELNHRMDEINLRDKEIDKQRKELKLLNEELDRQTLELNHRIDIINSLQEKVSYIESLNFSGIVKWFWTRKRNENS